MKPVLLHLKNIGPFHDEILDFSQLGEMFLICGKTGAGKSTIFNAITYAIYGKLSGSQSQVKGSQIRSDFVSTREEASITFTFLHHDNCYKIQRILPSTQISKRNTETKQPETIQLYKKEGNDFKLISNQKSEADSIIESLMGLTVEEFSRIIILPQGEFAAFLKQNSNGKRETLLKLFPLENYEKLISTIKDKSDLEKNKLRAVEQQLIIYGDFNLEEEKNKIKEYEQIIQDNVKEQKKLNKDLNSVQQNIESVKKLLDDFSKYEELSRKFSTHLALETEIKQQEQEIELAIRATPAYLKIKEWEKSQINYLEVEKQLKNTKNNLLKIEEDRANLKSQESFVTEQKEKYQNITKLHHDLQNGIALQSQKEELEEEEKKLATKKSSLNQEITKLINDEAIIKEKLDKTSIFSTDLIQDISQKITETEIKINTLEISIKEATRFQQLKKEIEEKESLVQNLILSTKSLKEKLDGERIIYEKEKEKNYVIQIASGLKPGSPCPVCGSLNHQGKSIHPQINDSEEIVNLDEKKKIIDALELTWNNELSLCSKEEGALNELKQQISQLEIVQSPHILQDELNKFTVQRDEFIIKQNEIKENLEKKDELEKRLNSIQELKIPYEKQIYEITQNQAKFAGAINEKTEIINKYYSEAIQSGFQGNNLSEIFNEINQWIIKIKDYINLYEENLKLNEKNLASETTRCVEQEKNLEITKNELQLAESEMNDYLKKGNFTDKTAVIDSYISQDKIEELKSNINAWNELRIKYETQCKEYEKKISGTRVEWEEKLTDLKNDNENIENKINTLGQGYKIALQDSEKIKSNLENWTRLEEERIKIQDTEKIYTQLYTDISDKNVKKIAITTWILGVYLDQVVSYANSRLKRISEGRYTLDFLKEKSGNGAKGLDLEILDSYTGKSRACSTLSGGETFIVSISLALALTDVVTAKRGGISLQSLFIDEGFGSLDPSSLEKALSILEEVGEGRCVGVISHVSEMKNRIPSRLEVIKSSTGSRIKHAIEG